MILSALAVATLGLAKAAEGSSPPIYFRGTQSTSIVGHHGVLSFSTSLPVALIWSARPPDVWSRNTKATFLPTSTVFGVTLPLKNPLVIDENYVDLGTVLRALKFGKPNGITEEEVVRIYNYLHNRLIGRAKGGEFLYRLLDEDGEDRDEDEVPFSFRSPETLISLARDELSYGDVLEEASRLIADTFIFFDAPMTKTVALRLGHDAFVYSDVFSGGESAAKDLLGVPLSKLDGVSYEYDLRGRRVPVHTTIRPLVGQVQTLWQEPSTRLILDKAGEGTVVRGG